ncbi:MAG: hypothetical protein JXB15_16645 [Anaerolineales bacterium]|nr:hypothetical protein [Anaerolineales bacterium]
MASKSTAGSRTFLVALALLVSLSLACQAVSRLWQGAPSPTASPAALSSTHQPTTTKTAAPTLMKNTTKTPQGTADLSGAGMEITGTLTSTLTLMPSLSLTSTLTATATLEPTPTVFVDLTLMEKYTSPFPLPGEVENFDKFGDIKISYQTDFWMDEVISFYRGAFSQQRLYELINLNQITDDYFRLVFAGSLNGMLVFVEGSLDEQGWLHVQVYYGY